MRGLFIGITTLDVIHYVNSGFGTNDKVSAQETRIHAGGLAANAAVTFSILGGHSRLITYAGGGALTKVIEQELSEYGVELENRSAGHSGGPVTASVIVNTRQGDRAVVGVKPPADPAAPWFREPEHRPDVVLFDTYYIDTAEPYLAWACRENIPAVLDGGSWKPGLERILPYITYGICSQQFYPPGCASHDQTAQYLMSFNIPWVCITRGELPILLYGSGGEKQEIPVPSPGQVRDTLGAGDIFHGAFCFSAASGRGLEESIKAAAQTASQSVCCYGPRAWKDALSP